MEKLDQISMAFLVLLQQLTAAERAVLLLHDVFDMSHGDIGALLGKNDVACRQLLSRARDNIAAERHVLQTPRHEHRRLLLAFVRAVQNGEQEELIGMLAEDAVLIADAGPDGARYGRIRNVGHPVLGRTKIAALLSGFIRQDVRHLVVEERLLNGEPGAVIFQDGRAFAAIVVSVADAMIQQVFVQLDPERHLGSAN